MHIAPRFVRESDIRHGDYCLKFQIQISNGGDIETKKTPQITGSKISRPELRLRMGDE